MTYDDRTKNNDDDRDKKKRRLLIIIIILLLLIIGGFVGYFVISKMGSAVDGEYIGDNGNGLNFEENEENVKLIKSIAMPGWEQLKVPAGSTSAEVDFYNPDQNAGRFHMTFELKLANGESLYKSGLVRAGDHVRNIVLNRPLSAGTYDAIIHIQPYTADASLTAKNNADVKIKLIVE